MTDGVIPFPKRGSRPGDIADREGNLWIVVGGQKAAAGELSLTIEQAQAAEAHGWAALPGTEIDGRVIVSRPVL